MCSDCAVFTGHQKSGKYLKDQPFASKKRLKSDPTNDVSISRNEVLKTVNCFMKIFAVLWK